MCLIKSSPIISCHFYQARSQDYWPWEHRQLSNTCAAEKESKQEGVAECLGQRRLCFAVIFCCSRCNYFSCCFACGEALGILMVTEKFISVFKRPQKKNKKTDLPANAAPERYLINGFDSIQITSLILKARLLCADRNKQI